MSSRLILKFETMKAFYSVKGLTKTIVPILFLLILANCQVKMEPGSEEHIRQVTSNVDDDYLVNADDHPENWVSYGRNYAEDRYSSLAHINKENVDQLNLKWALDLGSYRGIEATPLVVDGIMFLTSSWSVVHAINARTGESIWTYDPKVPREFGEKACCDVINRGVAMYKGRIYVGTLDGRLVALDAATGSLAWEVVTVDQSKFYSISGAPRIVGGKVIIGNGGAEFGVRGYITAYDALTGEEQWRFYTVPGDPSQPQESRALEEALETWSGEWWKYGGGGTCWETIVYDPDLNLLYVGTGNGSPWNRFHRSDGKGDNLYLSSILALNPDNGELIWHYQTTPGEHWDYTATQPMILSEIEIDGKQRKVLMQAPKNGFFYVLDRINGELISAEKYTYVNWAEKIDMNTGRPVEFPYSRYESENVTLSPGPNGGHNWHPMAYNHETRLMYIPVHVNAFTYGNDSEWKPLEKAFNLGSLPNESFATREDVNAPQNMEQGVLLAWDPVRQRAAWMVENKSFSVNGGVLTTAGGLVFQGTADGKFRSYNALDGSMLWEYDLGAGVIAPPVTYMIDGVQYVSLAVGWGGGIPALWMKATEQRQPGTVFTFSLGTDKSRTYEGFSKPAPPKLIDLEYTATEEEITKGAKIYGNYCLRCHGFVGMNGGSIPNLAYSNEVNFGLIKEIVLERAFIDKGMPDFSDRLTEEDVENVKKYILHSVDNLDSPK